MNQCLKMCQDIYSKNRDVLEVDAVNNMVEFRDLYKSGIIDYLCMLERLWYIRTKTPKKIGTNRELVKPIFETFNELGKDIDIDKYYTQPVDDANLLNLLKKRIELLEMKVECKLVEVENSLEKNIFDMGKVPVVVVQCALMLYLLEQIPNDLSEKYRKRYMFYKAFIELYCREYEDVAWYFFERHYNYFFCEQYLKNRKVDECWDLSRGIMLFAPNNYQLVSGIWDKIRKKCEEVTLCEERGILFRSPRETTGGLVKTLSTQLKEVKLKIKRAEKEKEENENEIKKDTESICDIKKQIEECEKNIDGYRTDIGPKINKLKDLIKNKEDKKKKVNCQVESIKASMKQMKNQLKKDNVFLVEAKKKYKQLTTRFHQNIQKRSREKLKHYISNIKTDVNEAMFDQKYFLRDINNIDLETYVVMSYIPKNELNLDLYVDTVDSLCKQFKKDEKDDDLAKFNKEQELQDLITEMEESSEMEFKE